MRWSLFLILIAMLAGLGGCTAGMPGRYMGIDTTAEGAASRALSPEQMGLERRRQILMLIAMIEGCYERTPFGFKVIEPAEAKTIPCEVKLAEIEVLSRELGTGRGPSGVAAFPIERLASLAQMGDKNAQLELGIRFEEGIGVERNLKRAKTLYSRAASDSGGTIWVYSPGVGNSPGRVIPVNSGLKKYGLAEAKRRLEGVE